MVYINNTTDTQTVYIPRDGVLQGAVDTGEYSAGQNIYISSQKVISVTGLTEAIENTVTAMTLDYATTAEVQTMLEDYATTGDVQTLLGDYTPTNSFATINGSAITEGGDIVIQSGDDPNAQHRFTAATVADMNALTGVSEGDVCTVAEHFGDMPQMFYDYLDWGNGVFNAIDICRQNYGLANVRFTLTASPYYDGQSTSVLDAYFTIFLSDGITTYYGLGTNSVDGWYCLDGVDDTSAKTSMSVGDYYDFDATLNYGFLGANNDNQMIIRSAVTTYEYGLSAQTRVPETTYQYNDGQWMTLAPLSLASSAMTKANDAYNMAATKVDAVGTWVADWSTLEYFGTFIGQVYINGEDEGIRIHTYGAKTERTNPKVTELVTSPAVGYIVSLTQAQYDALVSAGTVDSQTLYVIIPASN